MRLWSFVAVLAALVIPRAATAAEPVGVVPLSGTNVHPGYLQAAQELFRDHLAATGRFQVFTIPGDPVIGERTIDAVVEQGRAANVPLVASLHLTHLGNTSRLRLTVVRTADGSVVHQDSLGTGGGPDDLDKMLRRLAIAWARGERAETNAEIDTVTAGEAEAYAKVKATKVFGLRVGGMLPLARPEGDPVMAPGLGIFWLYDARTFMADVFLEFFNASNANVSAFNVGLGMYAPLSRGNAAPYLGGGLAYSGADFGGRGASGLRAHGAVGYLWGRISTVQIRGELGYFVNAFTEERGDYSTRQGGSTLGHGLLMSAGIGF